MPLLFTLNNYVTRQTLGRTLCTLACNAVLESHSFLRTCVCLRVICRGGCYGLNNVSWNPVKVSQSCFHHPMETSVCISSDCAWYTQSNDFIKQRLSNPQDETQCRSQNHVDACEKCCSDYVTNIHPSFERLIAKILCALVHLSPAHACIASFTSG